MKGKELGEELSNTQTSSKERGSESDAIILEDNQEESSVDCDSPNGDIGDDSACKIVAVNHHGAIPKDGKESPNDWQGNCCNVDESWGGWLTEVKRRLLDKVDDEQDLRPEEVAVDPEVSPSSLEKVEPKETQLE